jgi:hypothetical protein
VLSAISSVTYLGPARSVGFQPAYNHAFILRRRQDHVEGFAVGDPEIVFKFRHPDLQKAAEMDVRPKISGEYKAKSKAEALPFRLLYSHSAVFSTRPEVELAVCYVAGRPTIHLRVQGSTGQYIVVQAARPKNSGVRVVQHFPFLALLAAPTDGTHDLTELFVARYGVPKVDQAVWIRVFQHTDGWIDVPQVLRARVLPPPA